MADTSNAILLQPQPKKFVVGASIVRNRVLAWELARRELTEKHHGQLLGMGWAFLHPLILLSVYVFVFSYVVQFRTGGGARTADSVIYILAGFLPWFALTEVLAKTSLIFLSNSSLIKQVIFPIEILPVKTVLASMVSQCVFLALLIGYTIIKFQSVPWTFALLPILVLFEFIFFVGIGLFLGSLGAVIRDLKDLVQVFSIVGIYLLPIVYMPDAIPSTFQFLIKLNPLTYFIYCFQDVFYYQSIKHPGAWAIFVAMSVLSYLIGVRFFSKLKLYFGNVL